MNTLGVKLLAAALLVAGAGWLGYDYGVSSTEAAHASIDRQKNEALARISVQNAELDRQRLEALQTANEAKARVIVKYKSKLVAMPDRGCGFDVDERVLVRSAYCAAYPDHPDCVQADLPAAADQPGLGIRVSSEGVGVRPP